MAVQLSEQSKKDLEVYTRNFIMKTLQVIVQSRMGEKCKYTKKENSGLEWFSLPIPDVEDLTVNAKRILGQAPLLSQPINVEISVKPNNSNAYMYVEVWSIWLDTDHSDPNVKVSSTVYGRMSLALKIILAVSRASRAFRLAQRQKKDDFQIHYQFKLGEPNRTLLEEPIQTRQIAAVATPTGTIRASLSYTTNFTMPQVPRKGTAFDVKDNHFSPPRSRKATGPKPCNWRFRNPTSVEDLRKLEGQEKQETFIAMFSASPPEGMSSPLPQISEMSNMLNNNVDEKHKQEKSPEDSDPFQAYYRNPAFLQAEGKSLQLERPEDRPFASLMAGLQKPGQDSQVDSPSDEESEQGAEGKGKEEGEARKGEQEEVEEEDSFSDASEELEGGARSQSPASSDFVMLPPLEFPFADSDPMTDLGQFYREMQSAPQLSMCEEHTVGFEEYLADIKGQIDHYTTRQPNIDKFVKSVCKEGEELSD